MKIELFSASKFFFIFSLLLEENFWQNCLLTLQLLAAPIHGEMRSKVDIDCFLRKPNGFMALTMSFRKFYMNSSFMLSFVILFAVLLLLLTEQLYESIF